MKFIKVELDSKQHPRYVFVIGMEEAQVLQSLTANALRHTPHIFSTEPLLGRLRNISKGLKKVINKEYENTSVQI